MPRTSAQISETSTGRAAQRADVLVCGGGISGLSLAAWLRREGVDVHVLDKNDRPGGVIGTIHKDGFIFERGPNTVLDKYASFDELIRWAGLEGEVIRVPMRTQKRHVWLNGRIHEVPTGPGAFLTTPLLSPWSKLALLREPFVARRDADETIADFVRRRLGPSWLRNLVTPAVTGIWAGDPERMSVEYSFPLMKEMERDGGSLLRGAVRRMRRLAREAKAEGKPRLVKCLTSFRDGLDRLPAGLAARLGERYHAATVIEEISADAPGGSFTVRIRARDGNGRQASAATVWQARELVVAAETDQASGWIERLDGEAAATLRSFPYNRMAVVALGLRAADAPGIPEGFGFLVPRGEGVRILGAIANSNFLPGRAPAGCVALTIFIGGDLDPASAELADDELAGLARRDLRKTVGWTGEPVSLHVEHWPRAIPQYDMRHGERLRQIEAAEARWPGLHLVGNWRGGVSIADRVEYTMRLSGEMLQRRAAREGRR